MLKQAFFAELVGTFALCLVGGGSILASAMMGASGAGLVGIALAHGLILSIAVTAAMRISGGHINPAVTIAMLVVGRIKLMPAIAYIVAQCLGGCIAGLLLFQFMFANTSSPTGSDVITEVWNGTPHYDPAKLGDDLAGVPATQPEHRAAAAMRAGIKALAIEAIITFLLVFAIFGTAVDPKAPSIGGFGIGLTVGVNILVAGPLTGAAMNPARVLGTGLIFGMSNPDFWAQQWVYWVGPVLGAVVAAIFYEFLILRNRPEQA